MTGCIAAFRRFIPQSSKRCIPFFSAMKKASKSSHFEWNDDCEKSFSELKAFLTNPPILTRPVPGEPLRVYLSATDETIASVLVRHDEGNEIRCTTLATRYVMQKQDTRRSRNWFMTWFSPAESCGTTLKQGKFKLETAADLEAEIIDIFGDSQLVAKQINGEFKTHNEKMALYLAQTQDLLKRFSSWKLSNVDREKNQWADSLAKLASSNLPINLELIYVDILTSLAMDELSRALFEPLLRCLSPNEAYQAMVDVDTDIYGEHLGAKKLALKIIRQGLYWPTIRKDCEEMSGSAKVPRILISDNGTQFVGAQFGKALEELKIQHIKASVAYPQANGLAEVTNRTILQVLNKMIKEIPRCWVDKLPNVLWSYRTTPRSATGETPFRLTYGIDAVLPVEISLNYPWVEIFDPSLALEGLRFHNDLLKETREELRLRMIAQQDKMAKYFSKKVKAKNLQVNDLVLRDSATSHPTVSRKFKPTWEGPYRVSKVVSAGTYELAHLDGLPIKNAWNNIHLKKFYQ
ncbi:uncharacterized protein LOC141665055 [Apium graveolens]|uniref:uncharacterized protein LOC141665055 n=1 Tax=Apium graveolens TaxID=4045 RepID=UPI003D7977BF